MTQQYDPQQYVPHQTAQWAPPGAVPPQQGAPAGPAKQPKPPRRWPWIVSTAVLGLVVLGQAAGGGGSSAPTAS